MKREKGQLRVDVGVAAVDWVGKCQGGGGNGLWDGVVQIFDDE